MMDISHREAIEAYFDEAYYTATNPDLRGHKDLLAHFLTTGWREGRNPNPYFDVRYYLAANPDVAAHGINPLLHYVRAGAREGRLPRRPLDAARRQLDRALPPRDRRRHWAGAEDRSVPLTPSALTSALSLTAESVGLAVSISHDDYVVNVGGIQGLITREQQAFTRSRWSYLHISPAAPLPSLANPQPASAFRAKLRLDGHVIGIA